ncbi:MAG TPA: hypothetical protein VIL07_05610 [Symbiobacteriaceae bacterium]
METFSRSLDWVAALFTWRREKRPSEQDLMQQTLQRIRTAELQMQQATSLEELDIARTALQSAQAELQQLIRAAKRERGITLRPIAETEELHRNLRDYLRHRTDTLRLPPRKRSGTGRL